MSLKKCIWASGKEQTVAEVSCVMARMAGGSNFIKYTTSRSKLLFYIAATVIWAKGNCAWVKTIQVLGKTLGFCKVLPNIVEQTAQAGSEAGYCTKTLPKCESFFHNSCCCLCTPIPKYNAPSSGLAAISSELRFERPSASSLPQNDTFTFIRFGQVFTF